MLYLLWPYCAATYVLCMALRFSRLRGEMRHACATLYTSTSCRCSTLGRTCSSPLESRSPSLRPSSPAPETFESGRDAPWTPRSLHNAQPLSAANAAMNLARVLTCQSQEVIDVANKQHRLGRLSAGACSFGDPMPGALFLFCAPAARAPNYAGDKQPGHRRHQYPLRRCAFLAWPKRGA